MDSTTPALERALTVLDRLGENPQGLSAAELAAAAGVPRASLYRMLRVLAEREFVVAAVGGYRLGPAVTRLASRIAMRDLPALAQPLMDALCARTGESVKLVLREGTEAVTVAAAHSGNDARIAVRIGTRLPLYVGASQRLLLSRAPADVVAAVLAAPRARVASGTIAGARELRRNLAELAQRGARSPGTARASREWARWLRASTTRRAPPARCWSASTSRRERRRPACASCARRPRRPRAGSRSSWAGSEARVPRAVSRTGARSPQSRKDAKGQASCLPSGACGALPGCPARNRRAVRRRSWRAAP